MTITIKYQFLLSLQLDDQLQSNRTGKILSLKLKK